MIHSTVTTKPPSYPTQREIVLISVMFYFITTQSIPVNDEDTMYY